MLQPPVLPLWWLMRWLPESEAARAGFRALMNGGVSWMLFDGVCVRALGLAPRASTARLRMCAFWVPGASSVMYIGGKKKDALQENQRRDLFPRYSPTWPRRTNGWQRNLRKCTALLAVLIQIRSFMVMFVPVPYGMARPAPLRRCCPRARSVLASVAILEAQPRIGFPNCNWPSIASPIGPRANRAPANRAGSRLRRAGVLFS